MILQIFFVPTVSFIRSDNTCFSFQEFCKDFSLQLFKREKRERLRCKLKCRDVEKENSRKIFSFSFFSSSVFTKFSKSIVPKRLDARRSGSYNFDTTTIAIYFDPLNYIRWRRYTKRYIKRSYLRVAALYSSKYGPVIASRLTIRDEALSNALLMRSGVTLIRFCGSFSFRPRQFRWSTRSCSTRCAYVHPTMFLETPVYHRRRYVSPFLHPFTFRIPLYSNLLYLAQFIINIEKKRNNMKWKSLFSLFFFIE